MATNWSIESGVYYIKLDTDFFIKDIIQYNPNIKAYQRYTIQSRIPHDILWGYYRLLNGEFVIDEKLKEVFDEKHKIIEPEIVEEELKTEE